MAHWSENFLEDMKNPALFVLSNDICIAIKDKFPKAQHHYLILPKELIETIFQLESKHILLLDELYEMAKKVIAKLKMSIESFMIGYHSIPSMQQVHLHVISKDFNSNTLKTIKHWNNFNTSYFIPAEDLRQELKENGNIKRISETKATNLLSTPLKCNTCKYKPKHIYDLKKHLLAHVSLYEK